MRKEDRIKAYEGCIKILDERSYFSGICSCLEYLDVCIFELTELLELCGPKINSGVYIFTLDFIGQERRIELLNQCIKLCETKLS